jgi:hypothetical protein
MKLFIAILLMTSSVYVLALDPFLKRSSGGKCYYDDGSVINNGGRICPQRLNIDTFNQMKRMTLPPVDLKMSQESIDWRLKYGQDRAQGMSAASDGLVGALLDKIKEKKLRKILDDHPNSKSTLQSPEFRKWVAEDDDRERSLKKAYGGDAKSLDAVLTTYNFMTLLEKNLNLATGLVKLMGVRN